MTDGCGRAGPHGSREGAGRRRLPRATLTALFALGSIALGSIVLGGGAEATQQGVTAIGELEADGQVRKAGADGLP